MPEFAFKELCEVVARLRAPDGCPWDREQTLTDLAGYLREEADEVAEAIERGDAEAIAEELGDLLFNLLHAVRIGEEEGRFELKQVIDGARTKLVRRHPHVFGDAKAATTEEVLEHWNRVKAEEKRERESRSD